MVDTPLVFPIYKCFNHIVELSWKGAMRGRPQKFKILVSLKDFVYTNFKLIFSYKTFSKNLIKTFVQNEIFL